MNPVTDVCWDCIFPLSIGSVPFSPGVPRPDTVNAPSLVCACPIPLPPFIRPGLAIGYWEPARVIDVTPDPFCFPTLGRADP